MGSSQGYRWRLCSWRIEDFLAGEERGAEDAGVVAERGTGDFDCGLGIGDGVGSGGGADEVDVRFAKRLGHTTADDNDFWAEDVDEGAEADTQVVRRALDFLEGDQVSIGDSFGEVTAFQAAATGDALAESGGQTSTNCFVDASCDGCLARECFETTSGAAATPWASDFDDHVADFAGVSGRAGNDLTVQGEATANSGADEGGDEISVAATGAQVELGIAADSDVILNDDGPAECGAK